MEPKFLKGKPLVKITLEWEGETEEFDFPDDGDFFLVAIKQLACGALDVKARWKGGRSLWMQVFLAFGQMHDRLLKLEDEKAISEYVDEWVEDVLGSEE